MKEDGLTGLALIAMNENRSYLDDVVPDTISPERMLGD